MSAPDPVEEAAGLPLNQRFIHSHWKVRSIAYEEVTKKFHTAVDSSGSIFKEYGQFLKNILEDKNPVALEKGLDVIKEFFDRYDHAVKFVPQLTELVVDKCLGSSRTTTKQKGADILLLMVDIDKNADAVVSALIEGTKSKTPKTVATSIVTLERVLNTYGIKVVPLKTILKSFLPWFGHNNSDVRNNAQSFTIELHKWTQSLNWNKQIADLRPAQQKELQKAFEEIPKEPVKPLKILRCQEDLEVPDEANDAEEELDEFKLSGPTEVLSKITPALYEELEAKKWSERKEALSKINGMLDVTRLAPGDYSTLWGYVKKLLSESFIMNVEEAIRSIGLLAKGLRGEFSSYAKSIIPILFVKFKEKKEKFVATLHTTLKTLHPHCFTLVDIKDEVLEASKSKLAQVKKEVLIFVGHAMHLERRQEMAKKQNKEAYASMLLNLMNDGDEAVRNKSFECFGLLIGLVGEKQLQGHLNQLDKVKEKKVKSFIPEKPIGIAGPPVSQSKPVEEVKKKTVKKVATKKTATTTSKLAPKSSPSVKRSIKTTTTESTTPRGKTSTSTKVAPKTSTSLKTKDESKLKRPTTPSVDSPQSSKLSAPKVTKKMEPIVQEKVVKRVNTKESVPDVKEEQKPSLQERIEEPISPPVVQEPEIKPIQKDEVPKESVITVAKEEPVKQAPIVENIKTKPVKDRRFSIELDKLNVPTVDDTNIKFERTIVPSSIKEDLPSRKSSKSTTNIDNILESTFGGKEVTLWLSHLSNPGHSHDNLTQILNEVFQKLCSKEGFLYISHSSTLITWIVENLENNYSPQLTLFRNACFNVLFYIYSSSFTPYVPQDILSRLIKTMIEVIIIETNNNQSDNVSALNNLLHKILETMNTSPVLPSMLQILRETMSSQGGDERLKSNFHEMSLNALQTVIKATSLYEYNNVIPTILYELHSFFRQFPEPTRPQLPQYEIAFTTALNLLHKLTDCLDTSILHYMYLVPNTLPPPEIHHHIKKRLLDSNSADSAPLKHFISVEPLKSIRFDIDNYLSNKRINNIENYPNIDLATIHLDRILKMQNDLGLKVEKGESYTAFTPKLTSSINFSSSSYSESKPTGTSRSGRVMVSELRERLNSVKNPNTTVALHPEPEPLSPVSTSTIPQQSMDKINSLRERLRQLRN